MPPSSLASLSLPSLGLRKRALSCFRAAGCGKTDDVGTRAIVLTSGLARRAADDASFARCSHALSACRSFLHSTWPWDGYVLGICVRLRPCCPLSRPVIHGTSEALD
jgi:hypothetical protein